MEIRGNFTILFSQAEYNGRWTLSANNEQAGTIVPSI